MKEARKIKKWDLFALTRKESTIFPNAVKPAYFLAREDKEGNIYLIDTPCTTKNQSVLKRKKQYTIHSLKEIGEVSFIGNFKDFKKVTKKEFNCYAEKDTFIFKSWRKGVCVFYIKKGSRKSKISLLKVINEKIEHTKNTLIYFKSKKEEIENLNEDNLNTFIL